MTEGGRAAGPDHAGAAAREAAFVDALAASIQERRASGRKLVVLFIETGIVSSIDAVWGYGVGDAVRLRITTALRSGLLRSEDPLGEMGRGKFACVLSAVEDPSVALLAADKALRIMNSPLMIGEDEIYARPTVGIALWPDHGDEADTLLRNARTASMIARELPDRVSMYAEGQENPQATRFLYENRLRSAVAEDAFELVFQPQYDLRLGQMMGAESLLRWRDPREGLVNAQDAFAVAESAGLVSVLVSSILNRALRNCSEFRYSAGLDLRIGVKIPARALMHEEITDVIERALRTWGLRPGRLVAQIGDVGVLASEESAQRSLAKLKELGVRLSIDDSNLAVGSLFWLAAKPFREMRIDIAMAREVATNAQAGRILQAVVEMGHQMRLDVMAVGAGDEAVEAKLKEVGCDYIQSDHKGPALVAAKFVERYGLD